MGSGVKCSVSCDVGELYQKNWQRLLGEELTLCYRTKKDFDRGENEKSKHGRLIGEIFKH